jgi:Transposase DDE domain
LHHKQVASLFMVSVGVLHAAYLGVAAVGKAMALAFGTKVKHGIKQVDRFLSNDKLPMTDVFQHLIPALVGCRSQVQVSMDWTEFDADDHSTISLSLITGGKRTIPLCWLTVKKSKLKGTQRTWEAIALMHLRRAVPKAVEVVIVADRGFGDVELYNFIRSLDFHFVIRYRQAIYVHHQGHPQPCSTLVPRRGQVRVIRQAYLTRRRVGPFTVVLCKAAGMKEPWCLATSLESLTGRRVVRIYSRRFQCEETFRDLKDPRYGYGLRLTKIADGARRDRCILVFTLTYVIQTLFGVSSESIGLDKTLRANTVKRRTHSLFRQGRSLLGNLDHLTYAALAKRVAVVFNLLLARGILEAIP